MVRIREGLHVYMVRFYLENAHAEQLAEKLSEHVKEWISHCEGFVSANLHVSEDGKHLINYMQFRDEKSCEAYINHDNQEKLTFDIESINPEKAESDHFDLYSQQSIEDKFWSKTHI